MSVLSRTRGLQELSLSGPASLTLDVAEAFPLKEVSTVPAHVLEVRLQDRDRPANDALLWPFGQA